MHKMERELQQIKQKIEEKVHHSFLLQHIEKPEMDECKLFFLHYILNQSTLNQTSKERLMIATALVQIALDIHEKIPDYAGEDSPSIDINSQLSILAGDYYSGLYYYLLAEIEEREYITLLATSIKKINELKMELYYLSNESLADYLALRKQIQSLLIKDIAHYFHIHQIVPVLEECLLIKDIIDNSHNIKNQDLEKIIDNQLTKTNGLIDELPKEDGYFKETVSSLLQKIVYQNTSPELD